MFSNIFNITYLKNELLKEHSTFKIGGPAKYFIYAHSLESLIDVLYKCRQHSIKYKIIGGGSNILFDDNGFNGAIIIYNNTSMQVDDTILYANSGCNISDLNSYISQHNLCGFEFCVGVPVNLGGAIVNNFGAYNQQISDHIEQVTILRNNSLTYLTPKDCNFKYHSSLFQTNNDIILGATFSLPQQDKNITQTKIREYLFKRKESQPLTFPSAGSIFKRTENTIPAKLIDECGLKGKSINDAEVSTKHAGFIINKGQATSKDVLTLVELIKHKIYEKYNILLELEVEHVDY